MSSMPPICSAHQPPVLHPPTPVFEAHMSSSTPPLPLKEIPGDYGLPILGAVLDRLSFFYHGKDGFFSALVDKYNSTVMRVNMPPGPPFFPDSKTIMLLDQRSYPVLFDMDKVEKRNIFTGNYMPSTKFTGGFRVLPYLDPAEEKHTTLKNFCFDMIKSNAMKWIPEFRKAFNEATVTWEHELEKNGKADFTSVSGQFTLDFLTRTVLDGEASLGDKGPTMIQAWQALQLHPIASFGLPMVIEEPLLHTFPLPYALIAPIHKKLWKFFWDHGGHVLDKAQKEFGLDRKEACHNLMFFICFNTWGGIEKLFPSIIMWVGKGGEELQAQLREEVKRAVEEEGELNMKAVEKMELVKSTVYEALRIDPPVPFQYGKVKEDMLIESHDAMYKVRKGEVLGGYVGMVMKDPKVFKEPKMFKPRRFMGEEGKKMLKYVMWSNGREVEEPAVSNKQCAGKDFVNFIARLLLAEIFLHYHSFKLASVVDKGVRRLIEFIPFSEKKDV